jgi:hypothetical protein
LAALPVFLLRGRRERRGQRRLFGDEEEGGTYDVSLAFSISACFARIRPFLYFTISTSCLLRSIIWAAGEVGRRKG